MTASPIFIGGTASNVGKSWTATALCAWLRRKGVSVAPFKAQNMSNHSFPCAGGGEIGRAQAAQAEACGLEPEPAMNPILLKPSAGRSQVVVNGRVWATLTPREYYERVPELRSIVLTAYADIASRFDVVVIEGAGSMSEVNLRDRDLVNLWLVTAIQAPWLLVADIERGGVFASIAGTVALLSSEERALLRGLVINKFRGDASLFDDGAKWLEDNAGVPCVGVFPYLADATLDAEDSLAIHTAPRRDAPPGARIAIIRLPHLSNATDFGLLDWAGWLTAPSASEYDFVILPGTKNTLEDLRWMRERHLDEWVLAQHSRGATVVGVCGGFQMLGRSVADPDHVESDRGRMDGLGLLPIDTVMLRDKTTRRVSAVTPGGVRFDAYEIHQGATSSLGSLPSFAAVDGGTADGVRGTRAIGTYLHGALENAEVCSELFGVPILPRRTKAKEYERLADWLGGHARVDPMTLVNGVSRD